MRIIIKSCFISVFVSYLLMSIMSLQNPTMFWAANEIPRQFFLALLLGVVIGIGMKFLIREHWSYFMICTFEYIIIVISACIIGYFGHWFTLSNPMTFISLLINITIVYFCLCLYSYLSQRYDIKKMNVILQKKEGK